MITGILLAPSPGYRGRSPTTTGYFAPAQPWNPPSSARTSFTPASLSVSAARALVCSAGHVQYVTTGLVAVLHSAAFAATVSSGTDTAPGMWPIR